jgi:phosphoglycerate kinase
VQTKERAAVNADDAIYDVATRDIQAFIDEYKESPLAVWNGPLGYLEEGYVEATYALALLLQSRETESIVGGGNTVDALRAGGYDARMDFCSTGGGAMIQFLTHRSLVALEALHHKRG